MFRVVFHYIAESYFHPGMHVCVSQDPSDETSLSSYRQEITLKNESVVYEIIDEINCGLHVVVCGLHGLLLAVCVSIYRLIIFC